MTKKFFSFVAGISFFFGCADIPDELRDQAEGKCGGQKYTDYQFCANGQVYDLCNGVQYNPSVVGCCNSRQQYTLATEFCYSGLYVYPKCGGSTYNLETQACCGGKTYNIETQSCSGNVISPKCGSSPYNPDTQFCSGGSVYSLCGGKTYNPSNQKCESSVVKTKCDTGSNYYNPSTEFCSGSSVYSLCSGKTYDPSSQRCMSNVVETKCGTGWYDATNANLRCQSSVIETKCGTGWYSTSNSNQRCQNDVVETKCGTGSNYYNPSTQYCKNGSTPTQYGSLEYAGQTYRTVEIGTQTWMAENLNYNASGSKCYLNEASFCDQYGRLYNWTTAMANSASSAANPSGVQGICPTGWHLPSDAEWDALMTAVGGSSTAGTKLKATSGWYDNGNGTDIYGFSALPGGSYGGFYNAGDYGFWWSSTEGDASGAYGRYMGYLDADVGRNYGVKASLLSVRCVQD